MKVLIFEPMKPGRVEDIGVELKDLQNVVGGYIETVYPFDDDVCLVCNEEGKIHNLPWNRPLHDEDGKVIDIIAGTFFLCGVDDDSGEFVSLTDKQIIKYKGLFDAGVAISL